ncbi:MAG: hypothetical protein IJE02_06845 [Clostridia bacterium]|nr:hypothetical protein [Clostridia bacterium]
MKSRLLILILAMILCLSSCKNSKQTDIQSSENSTSEPVLIDLGICSAEDEDLDSNARNPWDMTLIEGNLYVAVGYTDRFFYSLLLGKGGYTNNNIFLEIYNML